jgi:hypothetical protein
MTEYAYQCPACGPLTHDLPLPAVGCRCGRKAKRRYQVSINKSSLRQQGRWDPQVGAYVASTREFRDRLSAAEETQAQRLNMDVHSEVVDARDSAALAELHGHSVEQREADLEGTRKAERAKASM